MRSVLAAAVVSAALILAGCASSSADEAFDPKATQGGNSQPIGNLGGAEGAGGGEGAAKGGEGVSTGP
jgi:hypothetical protein